MEESTEKLFGHYSRADQERELMLREHDLKLKTLDNAISIQSRQINNIQDEVTELKLIMSEMKSSNKILVYIASIITSAIVTQVVAQLITVR